MVFDRLEVFVDMVVFQVDENIRDEREYKNF
jgi:hypothetical protein